MQHNFNTKIDGLLGPDEALDSVKRTAIDALCKTLDFPKLAVERLVETLCTGGKGELLEGKALVVSGFGQFKPKPHRPPAPSEGKTCHPWDPTELPFHGPIEFTPSSTLLSQLDRGQIDGDINYTCPPLSEALTKVAGVPRRLAAQVVRMFFLTLTDLLIVERACTVPGLGTFLNAPLPTRIIVDIRTDKVRGIIQRTVQFSPSPSFIDGLSSSHRRLEFSSGTEEGSPLADFMGLDPEKVDHTP